MRQDQLNRFAMQEYARQEKARQREMSLAHREFVRQEKARLKEENRIIKQQQSAYNRELKRQQSEYNKELKKQAKIEERGNKLASSLDTDINSKKLVFLGFNAQCIQSANTVLNYGVKMGVVSIDRSFVCNVFSRVGIPTEVNNIDFAGYVLYLIKVLRNHKYAELDSALTLLYQNKWLDSTDNELAHASDVLSKHFRELNKRFGIGNIKMSNRDIVIKYLNRLPRLVMVGGIKDNIFEIYNSNRYLEFKDKCYVVLTSNSANSVLIKTDRKPVLKRGELAKVDGVGEIKTKAINDTDENGEVITKNINTVKLNIKYVKVVNRYVIYTSIQKPAEHSGMIEVLCSGGNRVYVYAVESNFRDLVNGSEGSRKVVGFGFRSNEIAGKITKLAQSVGKSYGCIMMVRYRPVVEFKEKLIEPIRLTDARQNEVIAYSDNI